MRVVTILLRVHLTDWFSWQRELMLQYADLDTTPTTQLQSLGA